MDINTFTRRQALQAAGTSLLLPLSGMTLAQKPPASDLKALAALEKKVGGRLGIAVLDTRSGQLVGHRLDERFGMCSTFKMPLAAAILREVDQGRLRHDQWVTYGPADSVAHAPVTEKNLQRGGMTVLALAEAAQTTSDNVAANLLLKLVGGPAGFTAILRSTGDTITRLDRYEPHMNDVKGQDERDTTTPATMARTTQRLLTTDWLSSASRELLIGWMVATRTGDLRIRAGLPKSWRAGDKTGTGMAPQMPDKYNDVAIAWPPGKAPLVISAFYETARPHKAGMRDADQAVLAEVGRIAVSWSSTL